ncbi:MAG: rhomboid family intramembrane serine protease [Lentisphaerae bacterium]|nr:rhomboid family intramembrane serine protease [Lentisphaerota bacterium]
MHSLICPQCGQKLQSAFRNRSAIYSCKDYHGQAVTLPGVRALCNSSKFANMLWQKAYNQPQVNPAKLCPVCRRAMKSVPLTLPDNSVLELDVCCSCQLVWFDWEELEKLPQESSPPAEAALPQKARTIMALHTIEKQSRDYSTEVDDHPENPWQFLAGLMGFPVEKNAPPLQSVPCVTWLLGLTCIVLFGLTFRDLAGVIANWGFIPELWFRKGGLTIISSAFLHGSLPHLAGNMYFLMLFGDNVEDAIGKKRYILLIIFFELFSTLLYCIFASDTSIPCVGASGFISGIIALYAVLFPQVRISCCSRFFWKFYWWGMPAWLMFAFWIIFQTIMAVLAGSTINVAYTAHIGGAAAGLLAGAIIRTKKFAPE